MSHLREHIAHALGWACTLLRDEARAHRADGDAAASAALNAAAREVIRRSNEVLPPHVGPRWLGVRCLTCGSWWAVAAPTDIEEAAVAHLADRVAPPAHEGTVQAPHVCRNGPYAWEWREGPAPHVNAPRASP